MVDIDTIRKTIRRAVLGVVLFVVFVFVASVTDLRQLVWDLTITMLKKGGSE